MADFNQFGKEDRLSERPRPTQTYPGRPGPVLVLCVEIRELWWEALQVAFLVASTARSVGGVEDLKMERDTLYFPFPPMPPQQAVASYALKACERRGIVARFLGEAGEVPSHGNVLRFALLESPTGTGKSLALLCASLAWQRRMALGGAAPQIVYGVRTHAQIKQMVGELRKCGYRPRMAVLGSREHLCGNDEVKIQARQQQVSLNLACRRAARAARAGNEGCRLYTGLAQSSYAERVYECCGQAGRVWDVEDLFSCTTGRSATGSPGCPYYTAHLLAGDADLVFCPHNYILDPSVSQCRSHHRERWSLKDRVIIIDEAHNLESCCREAGSLEITGQTLHLMTRTIRQMPLRHPGLRFDRKSCAQVAAELERLPLHLAAFLSDAGPSGQTGPKTHSASSSELPQRLWGLPQCKETRCFLQQCGLCSSGLLSKNLEDLALDAVDRLLKAQLSEQPSPSADADDAELLNVLEKLRELIFKLRLASQHPDSYVVGISSSSHGGVEQRLSVWLMSPGVLFETFASLAHAVILASGTLAPLSALQAELSESKAMAERALLEGPLEARHVVSPWQLFAAVLPALDGAGKSEPLVSTYGAWQSEEFVQALGAGVLELVSKIPGGVLCFLPSYQTLELAMLFWQRGGLYRRLEEVKTLVVEPRTTSELPELSRRFLAGATDGRGALCLAVYRGKMSEGMDFADDLCRAVICIGVPYPQMNDPVVQAKRQWNDSKRRRGTSAWLSGDEWYELQAHRAVNQAVGRVLRHSQDYGAVLLLDARWGTGVPKARNLQRRLSHWIQRHLVEWRCTPSSDLGRRLQQHFAAAVGVRHGQENLSPVATRIEPSAAPLKRRLGSAPLVLGPSTRSVRREVLGAPCGSIENTWLLPCAEG
ncbi:unnamed protein product [Durusdinium trenchii]|uniref:Helicase ATP-binding domain-containing protein n=1 Tax=Durusdinium trenchii TaxID=1381693 RepID=A0ABP0NVB4_9DINO